MGRSSTCTPEITASVAALVNAGATIPHACEAAGLSWNTAKDWMKRGKDRDGKPAEEPYASFYQAMQAAKAKWASAAALRITKASDRDWRAAAWMLERRVKAFAPPRQVEVSGPGGGPVEVKHMSLDELVAVVRKTQPAVEDDAPKGARQEVAEQ